MLYLSEVARITDGVLHGEDAQIQAVGSDSRTLEPGSLFVALQGERFDGHAHLAEVAARGGAGALVERIQPDIALPQVLVADPLAALQQLAAAWRRRHDIPVVAVTGSCGKTTVKEMLAAILGTAGPVLATRGNLNNHIGVPLTLLRLRAEHRFAVIEMGMNHSGEIAVLTWLAQPDIALINNARPAHLEGLGSLEAIARAKGEILEGLSSEGLAVLNGDDAFIDYWAEKNPGRLLRFGLDAEELELRGRWEAEAGGGRLQVEAGQDAFSVKLPLPGRHNGANALAAIGVALSLNIAPEQINQGLGMMQPVPGRLNWRSGRGGSQVLDDTYNANPASLEAAVRVLVDGPGEKILVLGNMGELGEDAPAMHEAAGMMARGLGVQRLLTLGEMAARAVPGFGTGGQAYDDLDILLQDLQALEHEGVRILVKGSRSARMERVVQAIVTGNT